MSGDGVIAVALDGIIFSRAAILRVVHEVSGCGDVDVVTNGVDSVITVSNARVEESEIHKLIINSAVDNQLRIDMETSNAKIRGLLIAKAIESSIDIDMVEEMLRG